MNQNFERDALAPHADVLQKRSDDRAGLSPLEELTQRAGGANGGQVGGANGRQVGGSHYASSLQHWDVVEEHGIAYLEGCATKYLVRHHKKNGLADLEKALHFTEKVLELTAKGRKRRTGVGTQTVEEFVIANGVGVREAVAIRLLFQWTGVDDLKRAIVLIKELIDNAKSQAGPDGRSRSLVSPA